MIHIYNNQVESTQDWLDVYGYMDDVIDYDNKGMEVQKTNYLLRDFN